MPQSFKVARVVDHCLPIRLLNRLRQSLPMEFRPIQSFTRKRLSDMVSDRDVKPQPPWLSSLIPQ
ncbi:hypothetical protein [Paraburkholderia ultramafica]|uniref:hypothetical protein n=1 Tax=Paraburkholderia ultramafica TaxID=1544867 RepID=UPI001581FED2|nr:hypothetical protein [Paraburkholderia ultramafica]